MTAFWSAILLIAAVGVALPMLMWSLECAAALIGPRRSRDLAGVARPGIVVLVPAHNEAAGIRSALETILPQLQPGDRAIVVADNCTDDTANIARVCGVQVIERNDPLRTGKSYALDFGWRSVEADPPGVLLVFDADCRVDPGAVDHLARLAFTTGRPVQASYLLTPPDASTPQHEVAALGLVVRNLARSMGLDRLAGLCFLNGSGMAFPGTVMRRVNLANAKIAEDRWMTVDLALAGHLPLFSPDAIVRSRFPERPHARHSQRTRWIHGHLDCMRVQGPRLLWGSLRQREFALFALAMDLFVPPLSLLLALWLVVMAASVVPAVLGFGWLPAVVTVAAAAIMVLSFTAVTLKFAPAGRRELLAIPAYVLFGFPHYISYLIRREKRWVRTDRDP